MASDTSGLGVDGGSDPFPAAPHRDSGAQPSATNAFIGKAAANLNTLGPTYIVNRERLDILCLFAQVEGHAGSQTHPTLNECLPLSGWRSGKVPERRTWRLALCSWTRKSILLTTDTVYKQPYMICADMLPGCLLRTRLGSRRGAREGRLVLGMALARKWVVIGWEFSGTPLEEELVTISRTPASWMRGAGSDYDGGICFNGPGCRTTTFSYPYPQRGHTGAAVSHSLSHREVCLFMFHPSFV